MIVAPATGETLVIYGDPALTQGLDLIENDNAPAEEEEKAWDRLTLICQRLSNRIDRATRLTDAFAAVFDPSLPSVLTGSRLIGTNAANTGLELYNQAAAGAITVPGSVGIAVYTGSNTFTSRTLTAGNFVTVGDGDGQAGNPTISQSSIIAAAGKAGANLISLANVTTVNANDSIRMRYYQGGALSSTNRAVWVLPHSTVAGRIVAMDVTSNITVRLDGAHWGLATLGNFTDVCLRVYAVEDGGTNPGALMISNKGGLRSIVSTQTSTVATNIDAQGKGLVDRALVVGTWPCIEIGWFLADFNDTGDLWTVQSGIGEIGVGVPFKDTEDWNSLLTFTPSGYGTISGNSFRSRRIGDSLQVRGYWVCGTVAATAAVISLPTGYKVDLNKIQGTTQGPLGKWWNHSAGAATAYASNNRVGAIYFNTGDATQVQLTRDGASALFTAVNATSTAGNTDGMSVEFEIPIVGWSSN
jgi:hypothetical protein